MHICLYSTYSHRLPQVVKGLDGVMGDFKVERSPNVVKKEKEHLPIIKNCIVLLS